MSDDLRTRIAAAIESIRIQRDGDAARMADAVIREVLTPEFLADMMIAAVQRAADEPSPYNPTATGVVSLCELRSRKAADDE